MSRSLGVLTIDLVAKLSGFEQGMDKAERTARKKSQEIDAAFSKIATAAVGAATAAGAAFVVMAKNTIDLADQLSKLSQSTGISTEDLSRLKYAADLSGVSIEGLASALPRFSKNIAEAAAGTKAQALAFESIGVSVKDAEGNIKPLNDLLNEVADKFSSYADGTAKAALVQEFFGKSGAALIPLLNQGSEGLAKLADESDRYGKTISGETGIAAEQFNDNLERMRSALTGLTTEIVGDILPSLVDLTESILDADRAGGKIKTTIDGAVMAAEALAIVLAGRLAASVSASALAFLLANAEAIRYQLTLARMAGVAGTASVAIGGLAAIARGALGILGGPVGLVVTAGLAAASFVTFGNSAKTAIGPTEDFSNMIAQLSGNMDELAASQQRATLAKIQDEIASRVAQITAIQESAAKSNAKLGKGELDRIAELQRQLAELGNAYQKVSAARTVSAGGKPDAPIVPTGTGSTGKSDAEKEAESLQRQYESLTGTLREQITLYGDTSKAAKVRYDVENGELAKLTQAQKDQLIAQAEQLDMLDAMREEQAFGADQSKKLDDLRDRYKEENEVILEAYQERYADLETFRQLDLLSEEEYNRLKFENELEFARQQSEIQDMRLQSAQSMFGSLSSIAANFAGEQSGIARAMFAVEKAIGIARSIVAIQTGIAQAAALPFPANLGAMATVAAATASIVSTISGTNPSFDGGGYTGAGTRTGGLDGKGGFMAMLHPNETVIDHTRGQGMGGDVVVNMVEDASRAGQVNQRDDNGQKIIDVVVANIRNGGQVWNTMATAGGLSRRGR